MLCKTCGIRRATVDTVCDTCAFVAEAEERLRVERENALTFDFVDPRTLSEAEQRLHGGRYRRAIVTPK